MKKSLLALAVLGAFAGAASAQSSVTLYGRVDLSVGKASGSDDKYLANGSGSRLGVRGVEDLGGGLQALFNVEHRFNADTGTQTATRFWHARSVVGLQGAWGQGLMGRDYTTSFLQSQLAADPWGWDTVVAGSGQSRLYGHGVANVRNDSAITYRITTSGFSVGAQVAEKGEALSGAENNPFNVALSYKGGPIAAAVYYEATGQETTAKGKIYGGNFSWDFGMVNVGIYGAKSTSQFDQTGKSLVGYATAPLGAGQLRASYGQLSVEGDKTDKIAAVGYHYSLSKRTTVYADMVHNNGSRIDDSKFGYDVGLKHNF